MRRDPERARANRHAAALPGALVWDERQLLAAAAAAPAPLILALDCVQDPHNLGACLRSADAAGALALLVPRDRSAPLSETAVRVACGAAAHTPTVFAANLRRTLQELKKKGVWLVGADGNAGTPLYQLDLRGPLALVLGSEAEGLRRMTLAECDFLAAIPMAGAVPCLNVSVAAGVLLFEAVRQRRA